jgi:hypothetical protein
MTELGPLEVQAVELLLALAISLLRRIKRRSLPLVVFGENSPERFMIFPPFRLLLLPGRAGLLVAAD